MVLELRKEKFQAEGAGSAVGCTPRPDVLTKLRQSRLPSEPPRKWANPSGIFFKVWQMLIGPIRYGPADFAGERDAGARTGCHYGTQGASGPGLFSQRRFTRDRLAAR